MRCASRYERQLALTEIGVEGQKKLARSSVLIVGAGGLGSPTIYYLAGAGIGTICIIDHDEVDITNLHRQILYREDDLGLPKAKLAASRAAALNSELKINWIQCLVTEANARHLMSQYDIIIDATDGFENKMILNQAAVICRKPLIHAGVLRFSGQISVFHPPATPCLRCVLPEIPETDEIISSAQAGIFGPAAGLFGCLLAAETIKCLINHPNTLFGRMLQFDLLTLETVKMNIESDPNCPICGVR